ncbi:MAG: glycosyltransferase [Acidobacteria bacterium]|nr:glycosyltransferase [Acidobacteriota bacterium]
MRTPLRIAVLSLHTCPLSRPGVGDAGGMNVYIRETVRVMASQGVLVDVFTRSHGDADEDVWLGAGCRLVHVDAGPPDTAKDDLIPWLETLAQGVREFAQSHGGAYDGVLSHYWLSGLVGARLRETWRCPHVAGLHTLALAKARAFPLEAAPPRRVEGERLVVREADLLLAATEHDRDVLIADYQADASRIVIAPPAVDTGRFAPRDRADCRRRLGLPVSGQHLLFVGRTIPLKGIDVLLEALSLMDPAVSALIVGGELGGREHESLRTVARRLGVAEQVTLVGSVPHEYLPLYYGASDVCVVPSYYESYGMVALEALACGRPVVASKVGGLVAVVDDGVNGFLVTAGSAEELAKALTTLLGDRDLRDSLGSAGVESVRHRRWEQTAETILSRLADTSGAAHRPIEEPLAVPRS